MVSQAEVEGVAEPFQGTEFTRSLETLPRDELSDTIRDHGYTAEEIEWTETFIETQPKFQEGFRHRDVLRVVFGYALARHRLRSMAIEVAMEIEDPRIRDHGLMVARNGGAFCLTMEAHDRLLGITRS